MSDEYHALLSPSGSAKWINCANAIAAEADQPDISDHKAADLGTDKHELLAMCLTLQQRADVYIGHTMKRGHTVDREFADQVQEVVDGVHERIAAYELAGATVTMHCEVEVPISQITGEVGATGTADVVLCAVWADGRGELCVIDAKFGWQPVEVDWNTQLLIYLAGALAQFGLIDEFQAGLLVIHQPALGPPTESKVFQDDLYEWLSETAQPASSRALLIYNMRDQRALLESDFNPTEAGCKWCRAAATCPARTAAMRETVGSDFDVIDETLGATAKLLTNEDLGDIWPALDHIEDWIKAVRGRVEYELLRGHEVPGAKLVEGRKGNRAWGSDTEAEALLKSFRLKQEQMYSFKLLGPKPILELLKEQPRRAKKVEALITQGGGKPHVAHVSDKRPALEIKPVEADFDEVEPGSDLV